MRIYIQSNCIIFDNHQIFFLFVCGAGIRATNRVELIRHIKIRKLKVNQKKKIKNPIIYCLKYLIVHFSMLGVCNKSTWPSSMKFLEYKRIFSIILRLFLYLLRRKKNIKI